MEVASPDDRLVQILTELQVLMAPSGVRTFEGPFEPTTPQLAFEATFLLPFRGSIHPTETWGVLQRLMNSEDGKYWRFDSDMKAYRADPLPSDLEALALAREFRGLLADRKVIPTYVDKAGSYFFKFVAPVPGVLLAPPGPIYLVSAIEFAHKFVEIFTKEDEAEEPDDDEIPDEDVEEETHVDLTRPVTLEGDYEAQLLPKGEKVCLRCASNLTKPDSMPSWVGEEFAPDYVFECKPCKTYSYIGPVPTLGRPGVDDAVSELLFKILEEFEGEDDEDPEDDFGLGSGDQDE